MDYEQARAQVRRGVKWQLVVVGAALVVCALFFKVAAIAGHSFSDSFASRRDGTLINVAYVLGVLGLLYGHSRQAMAKARERGETEAETRRQSLGVGLALGVFVGLGAVFQMQYGWLWSLPFFAVYLGYWYAVYRQWCWYREAARA